MVASRMREINGSLADLSSRVNFKLRLEKTVGLGKESSSSSSQKGRRQTTSFLDESCFYGRETDKSSIIEKLLRSNGPDEETLGVLAIVGIGGLGKTTLAQSVYNDENVKIHFNLRAWVSISDEKVDNAKITKAIIESATRNDCKLTDLEPLQGKLEEMLREKKFLIVLDDVWNMTLGDWNELKKPLMFGEKGSTVIVTTRSESVSSIMATLLIHHLHGLGDEFCWTILRKWASIDDNILSSNPKLEEIGRKIARKCKGVPLAVKTLGGLLHSKVKVEEYWEYVLKSKMWELEDDDDEKGIMPALRLSYQHLPAHLKRCFAYCSILPKDHEFKKDELIPLWMGEGLICPDGRKQTEDIGSEYFDELFFRSFLQYRFSRFVMHDLIHDLAQSISTDICFGLEEEPHNELSSRNNRRNINTPKKIRHLSLFPTKLIDNYKLENSVTLDQFVKSSSGSLRTFLMHGPYPWCSMEIPWLGTHLDSLFAAWKCLRVLSLRGIKIHELPDSIRNLKLLRYLDLSSTDIERLPKAVCKLYHLQILILEHLGILELPKDMGRKLVNIQLVKIRTFNYKVGHGNGIEELKLWGCIRECRSISISGLENIVVNIADANEDVTLKKNKYLQRLTLEWNNVGKRDLAERLMECLQPNIDALGELIIVGYYGNRFPSWIAAMSNLVEVYLGDCKCEVLPPLGKLPSLKHLEIRRMDNWNGEWSLGGGRANCDEHNGLHFNQFPCLRWLLINRCPKLRTLPVPNPIPSLESLNLDDCKQLESFPEWTHCFTSLEVLNIYRCSRLKAFPNKGLPTNKLKELKLSGCGEKKRKILPKGVGLHMLTSLEKLTIKKCSGLKYFPLEREWQLPTSLQDLTLHNFKKLEALPSNWFTGLTSLKSLEIQNAPRLASLPEGRLPSRVQYLRISGCPLLRKSCKKYEERNKIAHIPYIKIT
ncbi:PREDICTED: putative disease resistance protein RGA3 [Nelumbo nucifera]|nr:PREDICTED: putative disease resistance protein RGA3 [Nelumbo nucifera]XP_010273644.2 PREDICTED: putative disease resistance protein RGA3 [Nelumbo nucifera]